MGVITEKEGKLKIIEYTDLSDGEKKEYRYLNTSIFLFSMDFIEKIKGSLPFHFVKKTVNFFGEKGRKELNLWKSEKFIFDILSYCSISGSKISNIFYSNVICFPKNICYSPLKNFSGKDSISDVQKAILQKDRDIFSNISGMYVGNEIFELAMDFHYCTEELKKRWRSRSFSKSGYVEP